MAEQRPYRRPASQANAQLSQIKVAVLAGVGIAFVLISWATTQHVAGLLGYPSSLGQPLLRWGQTPLYSPWGWIVWWWRWHSVPELTPVWETGTRWALYPTAAFTAVGIGVLALVRQGRFNSLPDLHGSARWANACDLRRAGLLAPRQILPISLRRSLVRLGLLKPSARRPGIYLGVWRSWRRSAYLRDCGPAHVLVFAPTRSGKGVGIVIPTLLTWPHSVIVHDLKGENWALSAGWRKRMGQVCLKFDPTDTSGNSVRYNPLEQVRLRTVHEAEDVQNIVHMIVDPDGKGLNDHWVKTGAALLTGTILHVLYGERNKTLRGVAGLLSDPQSSMEDTIQRMLVARHDPDGSMGWRDYRGEPTGTNPIVAESMRELLNKSENERSGVFSTAMSFLSLYRDPVVAANTERSDFRIADLMNHERPVSLYLVAPLSSRDRLRPLIRLILNQIVRTLTTTMTYKNGRAMATYRHRLLLMLDEFPMLGRLEIFAEALSLIAGYGLRACLIAQDLSQIHSAYGHDEAITSNCDTKVAFTPNRIETARILSQMAGQSTVRHAQKTVSSTGASTSEPETARPLLTPDETMRLGPDEALVFTSGYPVIRATKARYYTDPFFQSRTRIAAPEKSDRIARAAEEHDRASDLKPITEPSVDAPLLSADRDKNGQSLPKQFQFLKHATNHDQGSVEAEGKERLA